MKIFLLIILCVIVWTAYELYRAPTVDERGNIIKPGKKLSDLWRKQR